MRAEGAGVVGVYVREVCVTYATDGEIKRRAAPEGCERRGQTGRQEGGGAAG